MAELKTRQNEISVEDDIIGDIPSAIQPYSTTIDI
jgi:hypothetical protein